MKYIVRITALIVLLFCGSAVFAQTDEASGTDINKRSENIHIVAVYPNPATERLLIEFETDEMGEEVVLRIRNTDNNKVILKRNLFTVAGGNMVILPVASLPTGVYVVQLDEGRRARSVKWTKM